MSTVGYFSVQGWVKRPEPEAGMMELCLYMPSWRTAWPFLLIYLVPTICRNKYLKRTIVT
jgi:hypothetical protein